MTDKLDQILEVVWDLRSGQQRLELRMDSFDQRLEGVDQRLEGVDQRLSEISRDLRVVREQTARNAEIVPLVEDLDNRVNNHEVDIKLFKKLLTS